MIDNARSIGRKLPINLAAIAHLHRQLAFRVSIVEVGNRFGVGNKLIIHYGGEADRRQIRELQLSGGYDAFDAPVLHFGLGEFDTVDRLEVEWSTGERSSIGGPFPANARYTIARGHAAVAAR